MKSSNTGFSLIEVILASALSGLLVLALVSALLYGQEYSVLNGKRMRALSVAEEGLEVVRNIRDNDFSNLMDGNYGITVSGTSWVFISDSSTVDNFARTLNVGTVDNNTKRVTSTVTWQQNASRSGIVALSQLLTNWRALTISNWASPIIDSIFNLTSSNSGNSGANALSIATANNYLYLGRANSAGREFYIFDISDPSAPTLVGQRDLNGNPNSIAIVGNYAYIASTDNSSELQIIDIFDPTTIDQSGKLTSVNLTNSNSDSNNADAKAVSVQDSYLYMVRDGGSGFLVFDLSNQSNPGDPIGDCALSGTPNELVVIGDYAYVVSTDNSAELQIIDITEKNSPELVKSYSLNSGNNNADAISIAGQGDYLFIGRNSSAAPEFYSVNIVNPLNPSVVSTLEIGANVLSMAYDSSSHSAFLATGDSANDFQVVDVNDPVSIPPIIGQLNIANSPQKLSYSSSLDRLFVASSFDNEELEIIKSQ